MHSCWWHCAGQSWGLVGIWWWHCPGAPQLQWYLAYGVCLMHFLPIALLHALTSQQACASVSAGLHGSWLGLEPYALGCTNMLPSSLLQHPSWPCGPLPGSQPAVLHGGEGQWFGCLGHAHQDSTCLCAQQHGFITPVAPDSPVLHPLGVVLIAVAAPRLMRRVRQPAATVPTWSAGLLPHLLRSRCDASD
jgi:hypothetical protein